MPETTSACLHGRCGGCGEPRCKERRSGQCKHEHYAPNKDYPTSGVWGKCNEGADGGGSASVEGAGDELADLYRDLARRYIREMARKLDERIRGLDRK
jgi:hypothetical protein